MKPSVITEEQYGSNVAVGIESVFLEKTVLGIERLPPSMLRVNLANLECPMVEHLVPAYSS